MSKPEIPTALYPPRAPPRDGLPTRPRRRAYVAFALFTRGGERVFLLMRLGSQLLVWFMRQPPGLIIRNSPTTAPGARQRPRCGAPWGEALGRATSMP